LAGISRTIAITPSGKAISSKLARRLALKKHRMQQQSALRQYQFRKEITALRALRLSETALKTTTCWQCLWAMK
jgi:hypothetical protein